LIGFVVGLALLAGPEMNDAPPSVNKPAPLAHPFPPSMTLPQPELKKACSYPARGTVHTSSVGTTVISFEIEKDGSVTNVTVLESSGSRDMDQGAISCARAWRYRPAVLDGQPVAVTWTVAVPWHFR
jgi:protein TonB